MESKENRHGRSPAELAYRLEVLRNMEDDETYGAGSDIVPIEKAGKCETKNCTGKGTHYYAALGALIYALCETHAKEQHAVDIERYKRRYGL